MESKKTKKQTHRYRGQTGGGQWKGGGGGEKTGEGGQKVQTHSYKISPGDVMCSMGTRVNNTVLEPSNAYFMLSAGSVDVHLTYLKWCKTF